MGWPRRDGLGGFRAWLADERGTTAVEYALLASVVAVTAMVGLAAFGSGLGGLYNGLGVIVAALGGA